MRLDSAASRVLADHLQGSAREEAARVAGAFDEMARVARLADVRIGVLLDAIGDDRHERDDALTTVLESAAETCRRRGCAR